MNIFSRRHTKQDQEVQAAKRRAFREVDNVTSSIHKLNRLLEKAKVIKIDTNHTINRSS